MTKKVILTFIVGILMQAGPIAPSASATIMPQMEVADTVPGGNGQVDITTTVASGETGTVRVNEAAAALTEADQNRKGMTKEEKMANAQKNDEYGGGITIVAMLIVISALAVLSILFLIFGKISAHLLTRKKLKSKGLTSESKAEHGPDSGEVIAAISLALAEHLDNTGHDMERTILTLRRMKRAYSPWNSKIYNIRHVPEQPVSQNRLH